MIDLFSGLDAWVLVSLLLALAFVLAFEFINGFHDTANAVATVIYTKAMPPHLAADRMAEQRLLEAKNKGCCASKA